MHAVMARPVVVNVEERDIEIIFIEKGKMGLGYEINKMKKIPL